MLMPVRLALIGCGKITQRLALPQLAACPDARIGALVDVNRRVAETLARQFDIDRTLVWTDWRQMLRQAEVEAVGVCVPNDLHAEVTIAALNAGKHVLVEKPMALSLREATAMIAAGRANRRVLMVEQTQRFDPIHETAHRMLRSRRLGALTHFWGRLGHAGPEYWSRSSPWFVNRRRAGGGVLMDVGIHLADLLRWLSGTEVARICCRTARLAKRVAVEDYASALVECRDGTRGTLEVSWTTRPYEVATAWYGTRGTLRTQLGAAHPITIDWSSPDGRRQRVSARRRSPPVPKRSRWGGAYPYFIHCIRTGIPPFVSGEEGRRSLEVVLAAYESARTGQWVNLPLREGREHREVREDRSRK